MPEWMKTTFGQKSLRATKHDRAIGPTGQPIVTLFPVQGFLGTAAPFAADFNLIMQLILGAALIAGVFFAKQKRFRAHGICQTTVLLVNLLMIGLVMWPSFHQQLRPTLPKVFHRLYYAAATIHALAGMMAEAIGLYIVIVAGTNLLPQWLCFTHWKRWMRAEAVLWSIVLVSGVGTYYVWYVAPFA
ncbi:MAG: hypothetical protein DMG83_05190 [Acidobacteria bacterium]|nr:MAG: hypothetical protein DMG83_05190 [Acidobacteriota bacterium]